MSNDDILILVTCIDLDVYVMQYVPTDDTMVPTTEIDGRLWRAESTDIYTIADWIYEDPIDWGVKKAVEMYGTARANGLEETGLLEWTTETEPSTPLGDIEYRWAIRDAYEYEATIKQLEAI